MFSEISSKINEDGFCVIENFLSEEEIKLLRNEGDELVKNMPQESERVTFSTTESESKQNKNHYFLNSGDKISYFYEDTAVGPDGALLVAANVSLNKIGHALHDLNPVFRKISFCERVKEICYQRNFKDPRIVQSMYIFKNPGIGGEVTPHQDASYLYTNPLKVLGFWIALDDATINNGCLKFIPGSHKSGVHRRYIRNPDKNSNELLVYDKPAPFYQTNNFVPIPVAKGSCVLIDGLVVHASDPNKSQASRHVYTFHVVDQYNTEYSEDNWLQPNKEFLKVYTN